MTKWQDAVELSDAIRVLYEDLGVVLDLLDSYGVPGIGDLLEGTDEEDVDISSKPVEVVKH